MSRARNSVTRGQICRRCVVPLVVSLLPAVLHAADGVNERRVAEEVEEALEERDGGIEITEALFLYALAEFEYIYQRYDLRNDDSTPDTDNATTTLTAGLEWTPTDWAKVDLVFEYEVESKRDLYDEFFVTLEGGDAELQLGRLYVPFGEYYSRFVTGPLLEFGETRVDGAVLSYTVDERLQLSAFVYDDEAKKGGSGSDLDWGLSATLAAGDQAAFGIGYLHDLADSDEEFLADDGNRYAKRVAALNASALFAYDRYELSAEVVAALSGFDELDADRDRPLAWNVELAYQPGDDLTWALRLEGSVEYEDAPRLQGGAALTWSPVEHVELQFELLYGDYAKGMAEDDGGRELDGAWQFGGLLTIGL